MCRQYGLLLSGAPVHAAESMHGWQAAIRFVLVDGSLLILLFVAITMLVLLAQQLAVGGSVQRKLGGIGAWRSAALAAFGGAVTPFCSCSTVPVLSGMLRAKVRLAACFSFLIASPVINEGVVIVLAVSSGAASAVAYVLLSALLCVIAGVAVEQLGLTRFLRPQPTIEVAAEACLGGGGSGTLAGRPPFSFAVQTAWAATRMELRHLGPYLAIGILIGAAIYGYVPTAALADLAAVVPIHWTIPLAALIAAPLYVSPMVAVPIGFALIEKGLGAGTVIAFLIAGAGTSLPEMILLGRLFRWPLLLSHIATVLVSAILLGFAAQWALAL